MKQQYVRDVYALGPDQAVNTYGWVKQLRVRKTAVFLDLIDSTGEIQVVIDLSTSSDLYDRAKKFSPEMALHIIGVKHCRGEKHEVEALAINVVGDVKPNALTPRRKKQTLDSGDANHLLKNRHLYVRNPEVMAILKYRHLLMGAVHEWFRAQEFVEINAPILTPLPLYDDGTAMSIDVHGQKVFLTQCVGYYMEACVHAFERVYNMGPSFRGEESRSKRHLMEYWHIKAELAWATLEEGMDMVESFMAYLTTYCMNNQDVVTGWLDRAINEDALKGPFPRPSYREVVQILSSHGFDFPFGKSLGQKEEAFLSRHFNSALWVVGVPRSVEPFPYVIDPDDPLLTRTADFIASREYGELLGVAEKITDLSMLQERMAEKGKDNKPEYDWIVELRQMGCVPHIGFGIGIERFLRWMLQIEHVRDAIPFPRTFKRQVFP